MADTYKFPGGNDVTVVRKQDIIKCIDSNIIDKEVALAIVTQCECDAVKFLSNGRWTGIPFLGSIRISKVHQLEKTQEQQELIDYARNNLPTNEYVIFRRNLAHDNARRIKAQKYYNYILSLAVSKDRLGFKKLCKEKGIGFARIHFYLKKSICAISNEYIPVEDGESSDD